MRALAPRVKEASGGLNPASSQGYLEVSSDPWRSGTCGGEALGNLVDPGVTDGAQGLRMVKNWIELVSRG